ncbi:hypothetical protein [Hydrogenophaga sp. 2FB]|uniref:hypothetical protein n=1 Tax=Hydrogenophaga sp. 2FB TaxID=2502187 RepID=UPI0010F493A7|nr:hypothetical protein [Hydrogenophaga sp. 2FB]
MNSTPRSSKPDVRNPLLAIPEVQEEFARLTPESRRALENALRALSRVFHKKGDEAWAKRKPPIAAYWRASGVNARHLALAARATSLQLDQA